MKKIKLIISIILLTNCIPSEALNLQKSLIKKIVSVEEPSITSNLALETEVTSLVQSEDVELPFSSKNSNRVGLKKCEDSTDLPVSDLSRTIEADFIIADDTHMKIIFLTDLPEDLKANFYVEEGANFVDQETAASLGYKLIEMVVGSYEIVFKKNNPFGTVTVKIRTEK